MRTKLKYFYLKQNYLNNDSNEAVVLILNLNSCKYCESKCSANGMYYLHARHTGSWKSFNINSM